MTLEGAMKASKGEMQPTVLPNYNVYEPKQWSAWNDNIKSLVVTNNSLIVLKTYSTIEKHG